MIKITKKYPTFSLCTLFLLCIITPQLTGMESLEQYDNSNAQWQLTTIPGEITNIIIAASNNQGTLSETCTYLRTLITNNKETILTQGLLQLNEKALDKFLPHYVTLGNNTIVGNLLAKGANPNVYRTIDQSAGLRSCRARTFIQKPLILEAIEKGYSKIVKLLITYGVDINKEHINQQGLLHYACHYKHPDIVAILLAHKADVNDQDSNLNTPLHLAVTKKSNDIAIILLDNEQVQVNAKNSLGQTPLHNACKFGDAQLVAQLLQRGALVNEKDNWGRTPLHYMCKHNDMINFVEIDDNAHGNTFDNNNFILLYNASRYTCIQQVKNLLDYKALVDSKDTLNDTPLHIASSYGYAEIVEILLDNGADVNAMGNNDFSPLHYAVRKGDIEMVKKLLQRGANVNQRDALNKTPLSLVTYDSNWSNNEDVKKLLIAHGRETNGFLQDSFWAQPITLFVALGAITFVYSMGT